MTLAELLVAMTIMAMLVVGLAALARSVETGAEFSRGRQSATQQAGAVLDRIDRTVREAYANESFPGVIVVAEDVGAWRFPDTLVIWHPDGEPADPDGLPRYNELVIYCPHPRDPRLLAELTAPSDTRTVPPVEDEAAWASEIQALESYFRTRAMTLTSRLRTAEASGLTGGGLRGAVRFETRLRPSAADWQDYQDGNVAWDGLPWVQGINGPGTGLRQAWVRTELQLLAEDESGGTGPEDPIPFFGSAALYYEMHP